MLHKLLQYPNHCTMLISCIWLCHCNLSPVSVIYKSDADACGSYQCRPDDGVDRPDGEIGRACTNPRTATVDSSSTRRALPIVRSMATASPGSSDSNLLELSATGAHRPQLPSFSPAAGKRLISDGKSQPSEGVMYSIPNK